MLKKYILIGAIVLWSVFLLTIEIIGYEPYIELLNIILGTLLVGFISYNNTSEVSNTYLLKAIVGLLNVVLGIFFIIVNFSLIHSTIILLIGGQLIGISIVKTVKKQKGTFSATSTKRPEPIEPEPGPEPRPL